MSSKEVLNRLLRSTLRIIPIGNWGVNAGIRYSFLNDNAVLSLQCNDLFESMYPKTNVRFESQNQNINQNFYSRNITIGFTYKFKGYKNKTRKEIDTSRFGIQ